MPVLQKCGRLDPPSCGSDDTGRGALGSEEQAQVYRPQVSWLFRQKPADPLLSPCVCKLHAVTASGPAFSKPCPGWFVDTWWGVGSQEGLTKLSVSKTPRRKQMGKQNPNIMRESSATVSCRRAPGLSCLRFVSIPRFLHFGPCILCCFFFASPA